LIPTNQIAALQVTNFIELAGTLSLSLINRFMPESSDSFTLAVFPAASGSFTNIMSGSRLNTTDNLASFLVTLSSTNLVVSEFSSPDSDGDGQTDYAESVAGTDPADSMSVFAVASVRLDTNGHPAIRFPFVSGRAYQVHYANAPAGSWSVVTNAVFTTPVTNVYEWVDNGSLTGGLPPAGRMYRVGLK
jgi:hypothetical protein